jgi:hypothetical protein
MKNPVSRLWIATLLGGSFLVPMTVAPTALHADDRKYHDADHNDDHAWNKNEDKAYRRWEKDNHRKHVDFARTKEEDQKAYWAWRHEHPDDKRH